MGITLEADHVIAAHRFLAARVARWARARVLLNVILRCSLLGCEFGLLPWEAGDELAMPADFADLAESEGTVFAYSKAFFWRRKQILIDVWVIGRRPFLLGFGVGVLIGVTC